MRATNSECKEHVERLFRREFGPLAERFKTHLFEGEDAKSTVGPEAPRPGVYVWIANGQVCKVGKSQSNSLERARDHLRVKDGTGPKLRKAFEGDPRPMLLLFNVTNNENCHWVPALESFLEGQLTPLVKAGRRD